VLASALAAGPIYLLVQPPLTVVYESYREDLAAGRIERAVFAPIAFSPSDRLRDQPEMRLQPPGTRHLMGTTVNGADLMANMLHATRIALSIGFISTGIAIVIGVVIGGLMGYFSGIVDLLGMRLVEVFSAIPTLLLLLCFVAFFQVNLYFMMAIIGFTSWVGYALFVRAEFLRLRRMDFVQAAEGLGLPLWSILFRHMLPNGVTPVLVNASFGVAGAILAESTLSFLGIGLTEEASWGRLLNQALGVGGTFYWWIAVYPGLAIFLTVYAYNLVGEALRDVIDPHTSRGR
jgi:peptide/nickel transport system permease protein